MASLVPESIKTEIYTIDLFIGILIEVLRIDVASVLLSYGQFMSMVDLNDTPQQSVSTVCQQCSPQLFNEFDANRFDADFDLDNDLISIQ